MGDRELLELAARASRLYHPRGVEWLENEQGFEWNPLIDDGDAFRLATKLGLVVRVNLRGEYSLAEYFINGEEYEFAIDHNKSSDVNSATRRAIVCAAAEIGKSMT